MDRLANRHRCHPLGRAIVEALESRRLLTTFALSSDLGESQGLLDNSALARSWNPSFIATAGDTNNDHDGFFDDTVGVAWRDFVSPYVGNKGSGSTTGNHFWPAVGNHDYVGGSSLTAWHNYFTLPGNERYYSVRENDVELFMVNSNEQEPDGITANSVQGQWLQSALAASTATWKLVMMHHPPFSSGWHGDTSELQWPFQQWGAHAVINGHDHDYERVMKGGFPYFTVGLGGTAIRDFEGITAGSAVRYNDDWGIMRVDTTPSAMTFRFYQRTGTLIDTYVVNAPPSGANVTLIPTGATWKYLDNGSNQGSTWDDLAFNDSSWSSGAAELGYGDGGEATTVLFGPNSSNKYITTYFRKSFTVSNPAGITALNLNLVRDDGAVVYLNGTEIYRNNMPSGTITYTTLAASNINSPDESAWYSASIDPALLVSGSNVIAVEMHQSVVNSSDLSFNFQLTAIVDSQTAPSAPSSLTATTAANGQINLTWLDNSDNESTFRIERSLDGSTGWQVIGTTVAGATAFSDSNGLAPGTLYYYRVRASNSAGDSNPSNVASSTTPSSVAVSFIPLGSSWKYLDNGSNQGTSWRATAFNDTAWASGNAELGYGDGDEVTTVSHGGNASSKYVTTYFRKSFTVADASLVQALSLQLKRDDGAVVYLNGTEIDRSNMPTGTIAYNTFATDAIEDESYFTSTLNPALLVSGTNVIAVEIHQSDSTSSDVSFNFALNATVSTQAALPAPWVQRDIGNVATAGNATFNSGTYTVQAAGSDIWNKADGFRYVYRPWTGNGQIIVRVPSLTNTHPQAKAGVMFRESLAANAKHASLLLTPSTGMVFARRSTTGGSTTGTFVSGLTAPYYLKLIRNGSTFTAYRSTSGTSWTLVGSASISMSQAIYVGLAVSSRATALTTATFSNMTVSSSTSATTSASASMLVAPQTGASSLTVAKKRELIDLLA